MNTADFIKLPAREAATIYRARLAAGEAAVASELHKAYYVVHQIRLADDRQVQEAMVPPAAPTVGKASTTGAERSAIRRIGVALSAIGGIIAAFAAAASAGAGAVFFFLGLASTGFALWLVGILEDRLIEIRRATEATPSMAG